METEKIFLNLIKEFSKDGKISATERAILINKATSLGIDESSLNLLIQMELGSKDVTLDSQTKKFDELTEEKHQQIERIEKYLKAIWDKGDRMKFAEEYEVNKTDIESERLDVKYCLALFELHEYDKAENNCIRGFEKYNNPMFYSILGVVYEALEKYYDARDYLEKAISLGRDDNETLADINNRIKEIESEKEREQDEEDRERKRQERKLKDEDRRKITGRNKDEDQEIENIHAEFSSSVTRGGNLLTPDKIIITDGAVTWRKRSAILIGSNSLSIPIKKIASVELKVGLVGTDIIIKSFGSGEIHAENFTKSDAKEIKSLLGF